jgi:hypothetical protein
MNHACLIGVIIQSMWQTRKILVISPYFIVFCWINMCICRLSPYFILISLKRWTYQCQLCLHRPCSLSMSLSRSTGPPPAAASSSRAAASARSRSSCLSAGHRTQKLDFECSHSVVVGAGARRVIYARRRRGRGRDV